MTKELSFEKEICLNYDIPFEYMDRIVKKNYEQGMKENGSQAFKMGYKEGKKDRDNEWSKAIEKLSCEENELFFNDLKELMKE